MAIAALPRIDRRGRQDALGRQPATPPWRRIRVLALVLVGLLLLALPTGLAVGEVLAQNAHDTVLHLQVDDNPEPIKELKRLVDLWNTRRPNPVTPECR